MSNTTNYDLIEELRACIEAERAQFRTELAKVKAERDALSDLVRRHIDELQRVRAERDALARAVEDAGKAFGLMTTWEFSNEPSDWECGQAALDRFTAFMAKREGGAT